MDEPMEPIQNVERRAWARHVCDLTASCRQLGDGTRLAWPARIRDISLGGLCLQSSRRYEAATLIAVEPGDDATVPWETRLVHVRHLRQLDDGGGWVLGCAFVSLINQQQLQLCRNPPSANGARTQTRESNGDTDTNA